MFDGLYVFSEEKICQNFIVILEMKFLVKSITHISLKDGIRIPEIIMHGSHGRSKEHHTGIFLPFQNRDPGPMILGKIIRISVKLGKWIQNRTGDIIHIWC